MVMTVIASVSCAALTLPMPIPFRIEPWPCEQRQTSLRRRLEQLDGRAPINGAVIGRQVLVFFTVVVVDVRGGNQVSQRRETFFQPFFRGQFCKVSVADIEIKTQARQDRKS